jgi:hypothetical protein
MPTDTHEQVPPQTPFSTNDVGLIMQCRGDYNRLGFAYQLAFVRHLNRFPIQEPLEIKEDIVALASIQLNMDEQHIERYGKRQPTVSEHQDAIRDYLDLKPFNSATKEVEAFLLKEACQLEQTVALKTRLSEFLRTHNILEPSQDTITRLIQAQREEARTSIYSRVSKALSNEGREHLNALLATDDAAYSPLHYLKQPPGKPSPAAFIKLTETLDRIKETGILDVDMGWINNNFQRSSARYARHCSLYRLKRLKDERRYTVLICFLYQLYQDTFDAALQMHDKLMNKIYNKADKEIDDYMKARRKHIRSSHDPLQKNPCRVAR